jgi:hypothetical protein
LKHKNIQQLPEGAHPAAYRGQLALLVGKLVKDLQQI